MALTIEEIEALSADLDTKIKAVAPTQDLTPYFRRTLDPDPGFYSPPLDRNQRSTLRAAGTEARRTERTLRSYGYGQDVEAVTTPGTLSGAAGSLGRGEFRQAAGQVGDVLSSVTTPLFDALQIGQFPIAGAALEYQKNGWSWQMFTRAATEFANALPGIDEDDIRQFSDRYSLDLPEPTRASWSDVLKRTGLEVFDENGAGKWGAAAGGLFLDIVLDPVTYIAPIGILRKIPGAQKAGSTALKAWGGNRLGSGIGKRFSKGFDIRQFMRENPTLSKSGQDVLDAIRRRDVGIASDYATLEDTIRSLANGMTLAEQRLFGVWLSQPNHAESLLKQVAESPEHLDTLMAKTRNVRQVYDDILAADTKAGLFDEGVKRANYMPGMHVREGTSSARALRDFEDKVGVEDFRKHFQYDAGRGRPLPEQLAQGLEFFQKGKKYDTLEERVLAAVDTEMDFTIQLARRGSASIRRRHSQQFVDAMLSDPAIARMVADPELAMAQGKTLQQLAEEIGDMGEAQRLFNQTKQYNDLLDANGYGIYRPMRKERKAAIELGTLDKGDTFLSDTGEMFEVTGKIRDGGVQARRVEAGKKTGEAIELPRESVITPFAGEPSWILPKPFINELGVADRIFTGEGDDARKFFKKAMALQALWKGYAVLSPGFHLRNMYSNWFLNVLGGVDTPFPYIEAIRLQRGGGDNIVIDVAGKGKVAGQGLVKLFKDTVGSQTGPVFGDMGGQVERDLLSHIGWKGPKRVGRDVAEKIRQADAPELNEMLKFVDDAAAPRTRKELMALVAEATPTRGWREWASMTFGRNSPLLRVNMAVGQAVENNSRMALFLTRLRKGETPEKAAEAVKRYLYTYTELTDFERDNMKALIPFYSWMRFNTVGMLRAVVEQPGRLAAITGKPRQEIEKLSQDWKDLATPDYFQEVVATRMPKGLAQTVSRWNQDTLEWLKEKGLAPEEAETGQMPLFLSPDMPINDLNRFNFKDIVSSLSPFIKWMPEHLAGRGYSIFLDRPIERYEGEPSAVSIFPGFETKASAKTEQLMRDLVPPYGKVQRFREKTAKGRPLESVGSELLGLKPILTDVQGVVRAKRFERRQRLRDLKHKLRDLGYIP